METVISSKRGKFLTVVLFLYTLSLIGALFPDTKSSEIFTNPFINPVILYYIKFLLDVYFLWNIWFWKKIGVYGKLFADFVVFMIFFYWNLGSGVISESPAYVFLVVILAYIFSDGVLLWAAKRKWKYFN